ncbi:MAG: S1 family peptidase, partial [Mycoplasmataceae bacterium]|nr:S1 family peptidase [Mycoplasmataceae bacterium]
MKKMDIEMAVKHASITEYVEKSIIPFILDLDDENNVRQVGCYGTGTLFSFLNKYFIVTAGHVVENIDRIRTVLGIPVKRFESEILTLGDCRFHFPQNKIDIAKYDIGIIELGQELYEKLLLSYHFLNENDIQFLLTNTNVYISGYPNSFTTFDKQGHWKRAKPFNLLSQFKNSKIEGYKNYDPKVHFLIEYSDIYYAGNDPSKKE